MSGATFTSGQETIGTTAKQLTAAPPSGAYSVSFKALAANVGEVYVGEDNTVSSSNAYELAAGDVLPLEILNAGRIWWVSTDANDKICWATASP